MTRVQTPQLYKKGDIVQQVATWPGQVSNGAKMQVLDDGIWDTNSGWCYRVSVLDGGLIRMVVGRQFFIGEGPGYQVIGTAGQQPPPPMPGPTPAPPAAPKPGCLGKLLHFGS